MPNATAFYTLADGSRNLGSFNDTVVARLSLERGWYIIHGKVVMQNWDGSSQNASASLRQHDGKVILDRADIRIRDDQEAQAIALLAVVNLVDFGKDIIDICCNTYNGQVREARLVAISVDGLVDATV